MSDLLHPRMDRHFDKAQLDQLMAYSASLGAVRQEWIADTWLLDPELGGSSDNPAGFDYLAAACEAAHQNGLRFDVVFKPFEGLMPQQMQKFPETFPKPEGIPLLADCGGFYHSARPFLAQNPHLRLARGPEEDRLEVPIAAIRLIKNDDGPAGLGAEDLTIWTSRVNGGKYYEKYEGPVTYRESLEWRPIHPRRDQQFRVLTLGGLKLPADARYIMVRCSNENSDFTNESEHLLELADRHGQLLPSTPSSGRVKSGKLLEMSKLASKLGLTRYLMHPAIRALLDDEAGFLELCEGAHDFGKTDRITLGGGAEAAVMRGKPRYVAGSLHPIYPEVREHWLELIGYCLDRGVDGINIRVANHNRPFEPWAYGFNDRVAEQMSRPDQAGEAARINGEAYTQLIKEASETVRARGKELGVHVNGETFTQNIGGRGWPLPRNFIWQWERWIRDYADYAEFRGAGMHAGDLRFVLDRIGLAAREAGIPFMLQSTRMTSRDHFGSANPVCAHEMEWVRDDPEITIYNLYETVSFTRLTAEGWIEGSPQIAGLVKRIWNK